MKKLVTITEASKILGVSAKTLQRWDASGKLKPVNSDGSRRMYNIDSLRSFVGDMSPAATFTVDPSMTAYLIEVRRYVLAIEENQYRAGYQEALAALKVDPDADVYSIIGNVSKSEHLRRSWRTNAKVTVQSDSESIGSVGVMSVMEFAISLMRAKVPAFVAHVSPGAAVILWDKRYAPTVQSLREFLGVHMSSRLSITPFVNAEARHMSHSEIEVLK